jgi:uncharacterized protein YwqG
MAIRLKPNKTERILFCGSKWWGDPDLPENMQYPTMTVEEDGEKYDYPLTFICQINCEDIAPFDPEGRLPHEGMLYFFGAIDELLGYESPVPTCIGEWPKGRLVIKYAKSINFETFQSCVLVDDEGQSLTDQELEIHFEHCEEDAPGIKMLGTAADEEVRSDNKDLVNLLQIDEDETAGFKCENWKRLNVLFKESDLKFGNWKKSTTILTVPHQK